jgi:hypothetical protein
MNTRHNFSHPTQGIGAEDTSDDQHCKVQSTKRWDPFSLLVAPAPLCSALECLPSPVLLAMEHQTCTEHVCRNPPIVQEDGRATDVTKKQSSCRLFQSSTFGTRC